MEGGKHAPRGLDQRQVHDLGRYKVRVQPDLFLTVIHVNRKPFNTSPARLDARQEARRQGLVLVRL